jgi:hypothetical protein
VFKSDLSLQWVRDMFVFCGETRSRWQASAGLLSRDLGASSLSSSPHFFFSTSQLTRCFVDNTLHNRIRAGAKWYIIEEYPGVH